MDIKKNNYIFKRVENKYLLTQWQYELLKSEFSEYMEVDEYGLSKICNIYYDTEDYNLIRTSIDKPAYKEKFRLRSYGIPDNDDYPVYLEIKKKYDGIVYKRRTKLSYREATDYLYDSKRPSRDDQILHEIDYFFEFHKPQPMIYIAYDRIATYCKDNPWLRITFDFNIRSRFDNPQLAYGDKDTSLLFDNGEVLMEIKVNDAYPLWLTEILSRLKIYPTNFSKYGYFYKQNLMSKGNEAAELELNNLIQAPIRSHLINIL